jgi:hypothetical protein
VFNNFNKGDEAPLITFRKWFIGVNMTAFKLKQYDEEEEGIVDALFYLGMNRNDAKASAVWFVRESNS